MTIKKPAVFSVKQSNIWPAAHVAAYDTERAAQITARLLGERFPQSSFTVREGDAFGGPDCAPGIRDCARSFEVCNLTRKELEAEAAENPDQLAKWHVFIFRGKSRKFPLQIGAYLDHDLPVLARCKADPDLVAQESYYGEWMGPGELGDWLDDFKARQSAA